VRIGRELLRLLFSNDLMNDFAFCMPLLAFSSERSVASAQDIFCLPFVENLSGERNHDGH